MNEAKNGAMQQGWVQSSSASSEGQISANRQNEGKRMCVTSDEMVFLLVITRRGCSFDRFGSCMQHATVLLKHFLML